MAAASTLAKLGLEVLNEELATQDFPDSVPSAETQALVYAIAAMVAEATKPKPKSSSYQKGDFRIGSQAYTDLQNRAPDGMVYEPASKASFPRVGKGLRQGEVTEHQLDRFAHHLNNGGLAWMDRKLTWEQFSRDPVAWIARAQGDSGGGVQEESQLDRLRDERGEL